MTRSELDKALERIMNDSHETKDSADSYVDTLLSSREIKTRDDYVSMRDEVEQLFKDKEDETDGAFYCHFNEVTTRDRKKAVDNYYGILNKKLPFHFCSDLMQSRAELLERFPYAKTAIDAVLRKPARMMHTKRTLIKPTLLVGPAASGKSSLARAIFEALGFTPTLTNIAGSSDDHFFGLSHGYSTGFASALTRAVKDSECINPAFVLDELDKALATQNSHIMAKLLPLLEPVESSKWMEPFLGASVNVSHFNWIFTANTVDTIPTPLLSRLNVIQMPLPERQHMRVAVDNILHELLVEDELDLEWKPQFTSCEYEAIENNWDDHKNLRILKKQVEAIYEEKSDPFMLPSC